MQKEVKGTLKRNSLTGRETFASLLNGKDWHYGGLLPSGHPPWGGHRLTESEVTLSGGTFFSFFLPDSRQDLKTRRQNWLVKCFQNYECHSFIQ